MVNTIEYWEVWDNFSEDGRGTGQNRILACFSSQIEANKFALKRGNYGQNAQVTHKQAIIIDKIDEYDILKKERIKQTALAKLTKEEKEILGL